MDCFNPSYVFASVLCVGYLTRDDGMCGTVYFDSFCADCSDAVNCGVSPCDLASDDCLAEFLFPVWMTIVGATVQRHSFQRHGYPSLHAAPHDDFLH